MAEARDFHCYSHVFENWSIPSDQAAVRLVIQKTSNRGQPVFLHGTLQTAADVVNVRDDRYSWARQTFTDDRVVSPCAVLDVLRHWIACDVAKEFAHESQPLRPLYSANSHVDSS